MYDPLMFMVFGRSIRACQLAYLDQIPPRAHLLIVGGGTGWIIPRLWQKHPQVHITYLEIAPRMIQKAQAYASSCSGLSIQFIQGDLSDLPHGVSYDIIFTHFFIDLFVPAQAEEIAARLYRQLKPGGQWHYADFLASGQGWDWRKALIWLMYRIARLGSTIEATRYWEYSKIFQKLTLEKEKEDFYYSKMIQSLLWIKPLLGRTYPRVAGHTKPPGQ